MNAEADEDSEIRGIIAALLDKPIAFRNKNRPAQEF